jgi:hypothetical protein
VAERAGESEATQSAAARAGVRVGVEWSLALVAFIYAVVIHYGVGPSQDRGDRSHWSQPTAFLLNHEGLAFAFESVGRALVFTGLPALALVVAIFVTGRSALARTLGLCSLCASLLFAFYGIAAPRPWEFFEWRGSAVLAMTAVWVGIAAAAPLLATSWLRLGSAARVAIYAPIAFAVVACIRNTTGTDPSLRYSLSPWPAMTIFGIEVAGFFLAAAFLGIAIAVRSQAGNRMRRFGACALGLALPVAVVSIGAALGLFPFALGVRTLLLLAGLCLCAIVAVSSIGIQGGGVSQRSHSLAVGAALIAAPLIAGQVLARSDYHITRDRHAQALIDALDRHYERELIYPDELEELVAAGDIDAIPDPAIGFRFLSRVEFHYQNFGTSYLLDFSAPRWVECAYSPPFADDEEDESDEPADEPLGGSWSCPAEPPELW